MKALLTFDLAGVDAKDSLATDLREWVMNLFPDAKCLGLGTFLIPWASSLAALTASLTSGPPIVKQGSFAYYVADVTEVHKGRVGATGLTEPEPLL